MRFSQLQNRCTFWARVGLQRLLPLCYWPMYSVRGQGPGLKIFPKEGPVIVLANHSCWFDPLWLVQVLPRPLTPLMAGPFYDRPILHWFAVNVFHAIRVPCCQVRREAPELDQAVAALDRGECVLIFPGAWLQRRAEELHRFGQGIWLILKQRPHTPVVPCWIEGGFGSFTSFAGGPPLKNKWPDLFRPIGIGVGSPLVIDISLLSDREATRSFLRQQCLQSRGYLGKRRMTKGEIPNSQIPNDQRMNND